MDLAFPSPLLSSGAPPAAMDLLSTPGTHSSSASRRESASGSDSFSLEQRSCNSAGLASHQPSDDRRDRRKRRPRAHERAAAGGSAAQVSDSGHSDGSPGGATALAGGEASRRALKCSVCGDEALGYGTS